MLSGDLSCDGEILLCKKLFEVVVLQHIQLREAQCNSSVVSAPLDMVQAQHHVFT
jgi:hypothetical protein